MTIHDSHPFPTPDDAVRRLRGRMGAVSLWTAGDDDDKAGLTVTSWLVASGEPGRLLALLDPDADLTDLLLDRGRGVVELLRWDHRGLADAFSGMAPAPGGPWRLSEWESTSHGPRLSAVETWALVSVESEVEVGWSRLVTCTIDDLVVGDDADVLLHRRGQYRRSEG